MPYEFRAPLMVKILLGFVVLLLILYNVFYVLKTSNENKKEFYTNAFSSKVVSSDLFEGRTVEFQLENGLKLYFLPPINNKIEIGDYIEKKKETYEYKVFRKNESNEYDFFSTYNFEDMQ